MKSGIYIIQSISQPHKLYVGSAVDIIRRSKRHLRELARNRHHSSKLQNHYNKYGPVDLQFIWLEECSIPTLLKWEQFYINLYQPFFNINPVSGSRLGAKHSILSKLRIGKASRSGKKESIFSRYARMTNIKF